MADHSKIEWTDTTWNPILGCEKVSQGCKYCYAIKTAWRLQHNPNPKVAKAFEGLTKIEGGKPNWTGRINFVADRLDAPLHWKQPRRIFVNSQSDLFHEGVSDERIDQIFAVMWLAHWHTFQVLTKRPERMLEYMRGLNFERVRTWMNRSADGGEHRPGAYNLTSIKAQTEKRLFNRGAGPMPSYHTRTTLPISNIWLGVSVEDQKSKQRIDLLRETPAAVRMLSLEPLLEDLGELDLHGIHWVIAGSESGPDARPAELDWFRSLRDQSIAAGVPYFLKQFAEHGKKIPVPKLDGVQWMQYPKQK